MDWNDVWKIILAAIASVGGFGVIIIAVVNFSSNFIADKMLKKYDAKLQKEIEHYKHDLEIEIEKYRIKNEKLTYVTQRQFDTEFAAYQKIFDNMFVFVDSTSQLFPIFDQIPFDEEEKKKMYQKRYSDYCNAFNSFSETLEKNAVFIPEENYKMFSELRTRAHELGCMFPDIRIYDDDEMFKEDNSKLARENYKKTQDFNELVEKAKNTIREYLSTLKVEKEQ